MFSRSSLGLIFLLAKTLDRTYEVSRSCAAVEDLAPKVADLVARRVSDSCSAIAERAFEPEKKVSTLESGEKTAPWPWGLIWLGLGSFSHVGAFILGRVSKRPCPSYIISETWQTARGWRSGSSDRAIRQSCTMTTMMYGTSGEFCCPAGLPSRIGSVPQTLTYTRKTCKEVPPKDLDECDMSRSG